MAVKPITRVRKNRRWDRGPALAGRNPCHDNSILQVNNFREY